MRRETRFSLFVVPNLTPVKYLVACSEMFTVLFRNILAAMSFRTSERNESLGGYGEA